MDKKIICYDIDGTLTTKMLFVPLISSEHDNKILSDASYEDILGTLQAYKTGKIAYEEAVQMLIEKHAKGLSNQAKDHVADHAANFVSTNSDLFRSFGGVVIGALKAVTVQLAVTAEPQYIADTVARHLGLDRAYASVYEVSNNKFTGNVVSSLAHRRQKAELLSRYSIYGAFGDSEGDIDMLANAQHAFCINPTDGLRQEVESRGWHVIMGEEADSIQVLEVLGIGTNVA